MMKSLVAANRSEKDSFRIPHSVQQSIPIQRIYADGIWQVGRKHSKTWRFTDINYAASSQEDRRSIFRSYGAVLKSITLHLTCYLWKKSRVSVRKICTPNQNRCSHRIHQS